MNKPLMTEFEHSCVVKALELLPISPPDNLMALTMTPSQLAKYTSKIAINTIASFLRLQRVAGVRTVQFSKESDLGKLAERCTEYCPVDPNDVDGLHLTLSREIVDVRALESQALHRLFNGDVHGSACSEVNDLIRSTTSERLL